MADVDFAIKKIKKRLEIEVCRLVRIEKQDRFNDKYKHQTEHEHGLVIHAYSISLIYLGIPTEEIDQFIKEVRELEVDRLECEKRCLNQDGTEAV